MSDHDDDHFTYGDGPMRQCISGFGGNAIENILRAAEHAAEDEEVPLYKTVQHFVLTLVCWCRYHNGERQRLERRVKELEALIEKAHCGLCSYVYMPDNPVGVYRISESFVEALKAELGAALAAPRNEG